MVTVGVSIERRWVHRDFDRWCCRISKAAETTLCWAIGDGEEEQERER